MLKHPDKGARKGPKRYWPAWRYGPALVEGGEVQARIFQKPDDVPEGWVTHPNELKAKAAPAADATPAAPAAPRKKGAKAAATPTADEAERAALIAELTAKDYDPAELAGATLDELRAVMKAEPDAANH
jgi:hypothetical protein